MNLLWIVFDVCEIFIEKHSTEDCPTILKLKATKRRKAKKKKSLYYFAPPRILW